MQVVVLAAGKSKRLQPVRDKNLINILGKPLIERQIKALRDARFERIFVVGGEHNLDELKKALKEFKNIDFAEQKDLKEGMAGAVLSVKDKIDKNEPVLVFSANDVVDIEAFKTVFDNQNDEADSLIVAKKVDKYFPGGYLEVDHEQFIKKIIEKPGEGKEPSNLINIVVHLHKNPSKLIDHLEKTKSKKDDRYEMALNSMIKAGLKMKALEYTGYWQAIKYPWHISEIWRYYFNKSQKYIKSKDISSRAIIKGDVIIEEGVKILEGAIVNGPCYLGENTVIANNALVREAHVGAECVIGFSTEVARSYLGENVWTHSNYIGDSVIGNNCAFGSGTVTGNLRLDEKNVQVNIEGEKVDCGHTKMGLIMGDNVRVGINCSFMPGVKVFPNSMITAGISITSDIPFNSFVKGNFEIEIKENRAKLDKEARNAFKKKFIE